MTDTVAVSLIALAGSVVVAAAPIVLGIMNRRVANKTKEIVEQIGHNVDGRLSSMMATAERLEYNALALKQEIARLQTSGTTTPTTRSGGSPDVTIDTEGIVSVKPKGP